MLWAKISKIGKKHTVLIYSIVFVTLFLATRLPRINNDIINPDGVNWHYRTEQFINGLKYFQFEKTYQHYHPGVTLMWVTGIPIELTKLITGQEIYNNTTFPMFHTVAKCSLILVQLILSFISIFLLSKLTDTKKGFIIVSLFTLESFFLGNSRLYHLDVLLTLFTFISLLLVYVYVNDIKLFGKEKKKYVSSIFVGVLTGVSLALTFLTKSIGIGVFVYSVLYIIFGFILKTKFAKKPTKLLIITLSFAFFTVLLFPALWIHPIGYLVEIFSEGERIGIRKGHEQIILGEAVQDAGPWFYPLVLLMKLSPFILLGFISYILLSWKNIKSKLTDKLTSLNWFLGIFYLGYFIVMMFPAKKIDRYMVVMFPMFAYYAYFGFECLVNKFGKLALIFVKFLFLIFVVYPLFSFFPYYFTYYSPVFINAENAHKVIAQKPFGVGMFDLKNLITSKYGKMNVGFIDTKPMEAIYPASKVFDIRVDGTSNYDLLILGPNEEIPEDVLESNHSFIKDSSFYINGLEYWRIHVKSQ